MNIRAPDQALLASREGLSEFFLAFARYEFALKATGFVKERSTGAQVDWNMLAAALGDFYALAGTRLEEIQYLIQQPPKKLHWRGAQLRWCDDIPNRNWNLCRVFLYRMQAVRNNLMHGSKQTDQESYDPNREKKLLACAMASMEIILDKLPRTRQAFDGPAG